MIDKNVVERWNHNSSLKSEWAGDIMISKVTQDEKDNLQISLLYVENKEIKEG